MDISFHLNIPKAGWTQPCALCGDAIKDGGPEIQIEYDDEALEGWRFRRVWHGPCYENFLDQGEESS